VQALYGYMFRPVQHCQVMWMIHNKKANVLRHTHILKQYYLKVN